jgi:hypothetical protein
VTHTTFKGGEREIFSYESSQALTARPSAKRSLNRRFGAFIGAEGTFLSIVLRHWVVVGISLVRSTFGKIFILKLRERHEKRAVQCRIWV